MLSMLYMALATALLHFSVTIIATTIRRRRDIRHFAASHGCKKPRREMPWDLLGLLKVFSAARHVVNHTALRDAIRRFETYGKTYESRLLGQRVIFTCHPNNIRHVLVTKFADFDSSKGIRDHLFHPITPGGIFALDGAQWKAARANYRDIFSNSRRIFDLKLQEQCFTDLQSHITPGETVDLQPLLLRLTLDLTTAFAMGEPIGSLRKDQPPAQKQFANSLIRLKKIMARDGFLGPVHVFLSKKEFHACCQIVNQYIENLVKARMQAKGTFKEESMGLMDSLVETSSNVEQVRDGVTTILIAGIDSVASLVATTFFLLARNQHVLTELRNHISEVAGSEPPSYEMLRSIPYLRYVFYETMRVYPPVPFNARTANKDTFLPSGGGSDAASTIMVRKGERVVFSSWGSHRSSDYFGKDADCFRPERWATLKAEALGYIPFNLGPRACPGQHFAIMEASYVTVRLLQCFPVVENRDPRDWQEHLGLNLMNRNGTLVALSSKLQT